MKGFSVLLGFFNTPPRQSCLCEKLLRWNYFPLAGKVYLELLESGSYVNEASQIDSWKWHIQRAAEIYRDG